MTTEEAKRYAMRVADCVRMHAKRRRVNQQQLADAAGVTRQTVNEWLAYRSPIPITALSDMCRLLGVTPAEVLAEASRMSL